MATFLVLFALTLSLLTGVVITGLRARRSLHLKLVVCALVSLGVTIWAAERLGAYYDLSAAGRIYPIHLALAKLCTGAYLLPVISGVMTLRDARRRALHRRAVTITLALTVATAVTGAWMIAAAPALP